MIIPTVLGDFLASAAGHIAGATDVYGPLPEAAERDAIRELSRVAAALSRFLGQMALPDDADLINPEEGHLRLAAQTRMKLRSSALRLRSETDASTEPPDSRTHAAVAHLSAAAGQLAVSYDLLHACLEADLPRAATGPGLTGPQ
jgi:hypothetical protein